MKFHGMATPCLSLASLVLGAAVALAPFAATADVVVGTGYPSATRLGETTARYPNIDTSGVGHLLNLPYFTVRDDNTTAIGVTNTDQVNGKAVKFRLRGAGNGDSLFDITLLLGPGDVWKASLRMGSDGVPELVTNDSTCTVPRLSGGAPIKLSSARLNQAWSAEKRAAQMSEGYAEAITMADIPNLTIYGGPDGGRSPLYSTIASRGASPACDAGVIYAALATNHRTEASAAAQGLATPTRGIAGKWYVHNPQRAMEFSGQWQAITVTDDLIGPARASFVLFPQTAAPYTDTARVTADPLLRPVAYGTKTADSITGQPTSGPVIVAALFDFPDMSTPYTLYAMPSGTPDANSPLVQAGQLSGRLAVSSMSNEYVAGGTPLSSATDWLFSMPFRRLSVATDYSSPVPRKLFSLVSFYGREIFHDGNVSSGKDPNQICHLTQAGTFVDEAGTVAPAGDTLAFCGAVSVLTFGPASVLSAGVAVAKAAEGVPTRGWGLIGFKDPVSNIMGIPFIGSAFLKTADGVTNGIGGTFGLRYDHSLR